MKENGIVYEEPPYNWTNNICFLNVIFLEYIYILRLKIFQKISY